MYVVHWTQKYDQEVPRGDQ